MDRLGCRHRSAAIGRRHTERHWIAAVVGVVATVGATAYGASEQKAAQGRAARQQRGLAAAMAMSDAELAEQKRLTQLLQPYELEAAGLTANYRPDGTIASITKRAPTPEESLDAEVRKAANEKVLRGLRGELDIDPAAKMALDRSQSQEEAYLRQTQGPDYKLGTAGQTQQAAFSAERAGIESAIRRGEMTAADAIARTRDANAMANDRFRQGLMAGIPNQQKMRSTGEILDRAEALRSFDQRPGYGQLAGGLMKGLTSAYDAYRRSKLEKPSVYSTNGGIGSPAYQQQRAGERDYTPYVPPSYESYYNYAPSTAPAAPAEYYQGGLGVAAY